MAKHLTPQQLNAQMQINRLVQAEVRRQIEAVTMSERVVRGIRAAHLADIVIGMTILIDHYKENKEFVTDFLEKWRECLMQYNSGDIQLKQMKGHIELFTGIDIDKYVTENLVITEIEENENGKNNCDGNTDGDASHNRDERTCG